MSIQQVGFERFSVASARNFEDVLARLDEGIGRPDMRRFREEISSAGSFAEYQSVVHGAVGKSDLMEFLRLDLGGPMRKDPDAKAYNIVRIIAGNPLIMKQMVEYVPDAGSYAPVTILVYERKDGVHLCYDTMASLIAGSGDERALAVARSLDEKVIKLLNSAAA